MNSPLDRDLTSALRDVFHRQPIPAVDVARILERSLHQRSPRKTTARVRLGAVLAVAAMAVLVMTVGTQRGWALGIGGHQSLAEAIAKAFNMLHLPLPKNGTTITFHIENDVYADESRIQAGLPFRLIEPSGVPASYGVRIHGKTRRDGNVGAYWLMRPAPATFHGARAISDDSIEVDEFLRGHASVFPSSSSADKSVSLEFNPDGSLRRAHVIVANTRVVRHFTIGNVDVAVIVEARDGRPGRIADGIRSAMLTKAARQRERERRTSSRAHPSSGSG
jgi:hypothetical protein